MLSSGSPIQKPKSNAFQLQPSSTSRLPGPPCVLDSEGSKSPEAGDLPSAYLNMEHDRVDNEYIEDPSDSYMVPSCGADKVNVNHNRKGQKGSSQTPPPLTARQRSSSKVGHASPRHMPLNDLPPAAVSKANPGATAAASMTPGASPGPLPPREAYRARQSIPGDIYEDIPADSYDALHEKEYDFEKKDWQSLAVNLPQTRTNDKTAQSVRSNHSGALSTASATSVLSTDSRVYLLANNDNDDNLHRQPPSRNFVAKHPNNDVSGRGDDETDGSQSKTKHCLRCSPACCNFLVSIVAITALALALFNLAKLLTLSPEDSTTQSYITLIPFLNDPQLRAKLEQLEQLESSHQELVEKISYLEDIIRILKSNNSRLSESVQKNRDKISDLHQREASTGTDLSRMSTRMTELELRGLQGIRNFSACVYGNSSKWQETFPDLMLTPLIPVDEDTAKNWIIMGASCSAVNASSSSLSATKQADWPFQPLRFRCSCQGTPQRSNTNSTLRLCVLHYWKCPRIS